MTDEFVLTGSGPRGNGTVVHGVDSWLARTIRGDVLTSHTYTDHHRDQVFLRYTFRCTKRLSMVRHEFAAALADHYDLHGQVHAAWQRPRILIMCSTLDHCLVHLLTRWHRNELPADIVSVVSNHDTLKPLAVHHGVPFHHIPVTADTKRAAEADLQHLTAMYSIDLIVLANYKQILSPDLCRDLSASGISAINIHPSLLPAFEGARAYQQAMERGVRIVGSTAHYVTDELDQGQIIDQESVRLESTQPTLQHYERAGRITDIAVTQRAVDWHCERRLLVNGDRVVILR